MSIHIAVGILISIIPIILVYTDVTEDEYVERGKFAITISTVFAIIAILLIIYKD